MHSLKTRAGGHGVAQDTAAPSQRRRTILRAGALAAAGGAAPLLALAQAGKTAADLKNVTLRVGDQTGATYGLFRAAGLLDAIPYKVEWSTFPAAVNLHEALKAGAIDIGGANDSPTVSAIAGGSKISAVASWFDGGKSAVVLVPKNSTVRTVAELRGKTISPTTRGSVGHYLTVGVLQEAAISPADVKLAFLQPGDASAAFNSGAIDAWSIWGVFRARALGALGARVLHDGHGINSGQYVLSATQAAVRDPGKLAAIAWQARLMDQAYAWARANRERYIDWYAEFSKQDKAISSSLYEENVNYRRVAIDDVFLARLQKTYKTWIEAGMLSPGIDLNQYVFRNLQPA
jgi:sulfonate transport system substrate-binding protein